MKRWRGFVRPGLGLFRNRTEAGYTITEVMIVLAVSSLMFVAVAATFRGRQARTEFTQAVRNFEAKLQSSMNEVLNGVYQPINCSTPAVSGPPNFSGPANSGACVFVGKAYVPQTTRSDIYTMVGRRTTGNPPHDVINLAEAQPRVISTSENYTHSFRLQIRRMVSLADNTTLVHALGFVVPLAGATSIQADQSAGSRQASLYGLTSVTSLAPSGVVDTTNFGPLPNGIVICLRGQNNQRAEIRVGAANSQTMLVSELDTPNSGACLNA